MLDDAPTVRLDAVDAFELAERLRGSPAFDLIEGSILAGRYRLLHPIATGWVAFDERFIRAVVIEPIVGPGNPPERIRREAAKDVRLTDAVIMGDAAYAVRITMVF